MAIPLPTTTVGILRRTVDRTKDTMVDGPALTFTPTAATAVRAHLSAPKASEQAAGGSQQITDVVMLCDPCDVNHFDRVIDAYDSGVYEVSWVIHRHGIGGDHVQAGLRIVQGTEATK